MDPLLGPAPWAWIVAAALVFEPDYNDVEMAWLDGLAPERRCVVRFDDFVGDLEGTMTRVYREALGLSALGAHVPRQHGARDRSNYTVDRSLAQLGVDRAALDARFTAWNQWYKALSYAGPAAQSKSL